MLHSEVVSAKTYTVLYSEGVTRPSTVENASWNLKPITARHIGNVAVFLRWAALRIRLILKEGNRSADPDSGVPCYSNRGACPQRVLISPPDRCMRSFHAILSIGVFRGFLAVYLSSFMRCIRSDSSHPPELNSIFGHSEVESHMQPWPQ